MGFWLVALLLPPQLLEIGIWGLLLGAPLGLVLLSWTLQFPSWFCRCLQTRALDPHSDHGIAFQKVIDRSVIDKVDIQVSGPKNGHWINAVALPSLKGPRIVMSAPLLKRLSLPEATAIFAHELAHIEDFSENWLRNSRLIDSLALLFGCIVLPSISLLNGNSEPWMSWVWFGTVIAVYVSKAKGMQKREVFADTRGLELFPHLDDFISGLSKVYVTAKIPRRVQIEVDQSASHPSLARRIQELNTHAEKIGLTESRPSQQKELEALPDEEATFRNKHFFQSSESENEFVVLEQNRVVWLTINESADINGIAVTEDWLRSNAKTEQSSSYSALLELRLLHKGKKTFLRTLEAPRILRQFPLKEEDIPKVTHILDTVDTKISPLKNINSQQHSTIRLALLGSAFALFFAMTQGVVSLGAAAFFLTGTIIAVAKPTRSWIGATGGATGVFAISRLFAQDDKTWWSQSSWILLGAVAALGVFHWFQAVRRTKENDTTSLDEGNSGKTAGLILAVGCLCLIPLFLSLRGGDSLTKLSMMSLHAHVAFLPFLCAGCALLVASKFASRIIGTLLLLIGLAPLFLGSSFFRYEIASEPLIEHGAPEIPWKNAEVEEIDHVRLTGDHWGLQLSPDGKWFTTQTEDHTFSIHNWNGDEIQLEAQALSWTEDSRCLALIKQSNKLQLVSFTPDTVNDKARHFELDLQDIDQHFELWFRGDQWQILSGKDTASTTFFEGYFSSDAVQKQNWYHNSFEDTWRHKAHNGNLLELSWNPKPTKANPRTFEKIQDFYYWPTYLHSIDANGSVVDIGTSNLWVTANTNFDGNVRLISQTDQDAHLWSLEESSKLIPIARLPIITAWWIQNEHLVLLTKKALHISDLNGQSGCRLALNQESAWDDEISLSMNKLAMLNNRDGQETVTLMSLPNDVLSSPTLLAKGLTETE